MTGVGLWVTNYRHPSEPIRVAALFWQVGAVASNSLSLRTALILGFPIVVEFSNKVRSIKDLGTKQMLKERTFRYLAPGIKHKIQSQVLKLHV